jgi:transposase
VRASSRQVNGLLEWADNWPRRTWAIEGARGLGQLLAQQLIAAGEHVLDVPPKLAARVRLLDSGQINKNDDNDARSVAVATLRAHELPELAAEDHTMVMRVWARRYHDLGRLRTQAICRLHAVLCELVPGGVRKHARTRQAIEVLDRFVADSPITQAKLQLARDLVARLRPRPPPLPHPRAVRLLQRHRPDRGLLRRAGHRPAVPARQPAAELPVD